MRHCLLGAVIIALICSNSLSAQNYLEDSKDYIYPFETIDDQVLLHHIDQIADSALIVGLGEVSHYTKECYDLKHQIILKLIEKGFGGLILEVDFGQAVLWNEYVTNGKGDIDNLIAESGWFTYRTQEFKDLLIAIREHNKTADSPFQIFGMEMTAQNHNLAWLAKYFSQNLTRSDSLVSALKAERKIVAFQPHERSEVKDYWQLHYEVSDVLTENETSLRAKGGDRAFEIAFQMGEILKQYATYIAQDEFLLQVELRDIFSTRNVYWTLSQLGEEGKVAIWAHNGHIVKESVLFSYDILGHYLSQAFGEYYYSVGFTFNEGEFGAFSSDGFKRWQLSAVNEPSLTKELDALNSPYLLLDLRENIAAISDKKSILYKEMPIRTDVSESFSEDNGGMMTIDLSNSYDCLIYIDKTSYPTTIEWKR